MVTKIHIDILDKDKVVKQYRLIKLQHRPDRTIIMKDNNREDEHSIKNNIENVLVDIINDAIHSSYDFNIISIDVITLLDYIINYALKDIDNKLI